MTATEIRWTGYSTKTSSDLSIDLCVLRDACHELFCIFGDFLCIRDARRRGNKLTEIGDICTVRLFCIIIRHFYKLWAFENTLQIIFTTFLAMPDSSTLDKPGAAHMSKIISPGQGPNTCPTTTEGKFWRNSKCGRTPLREGQLYRGNLIWIATPLQTKKIWQPWARAIFITFICADISKQWNQNQVWKGTPYYIMAHGRMEVIIGALPKKG